MSILDRLKKEFNQMADTLQRLQMYRGDVISATDKRLEIILAKTSFNEDIKNKLRETRNFLQNAGSAGSKLLGATDRETMLTLTLGHCKKAAKCLHEVVSMM